MGDKDLGINPFELITATPKFIGWLRQVQKVDKDEKTIVYLHVLGELFKWFGKVIDEKELKEFFKSQSKVFLSLSDVYKKQKFD